MHHRHGGVASTVASQQEGFDSQLGQSGWDEMGWFKTCLKAHVVMLLVLYFHYRSSCFYRILGMSALMVFALIAISHQNQKERMNE